MSASRSRMSSRSASGPTSGWYSPAGVKSRCAPSRAPASSTWLISSSSSEIARPPSASRAIARSASRKLSTWSAIWPANSRVPESSWGASGWSSVISGSPPGKSTAQGHFVRVLEVPPHRQSTRQTRHAQAQRLEHPGEVRRGGLALEVRIGREDHLADRAVGEPDHELADAQLVGADAVDRRDGAAQHVVAAAELAGPLDRDDVLVLLHHADDGGVAARVAADAAQLR